MALCVTPALFSIEIQGVSYSLKVAKWIFVFTEFLFNSMKANFIIKVMIYTQKHWNLVFIQRWCKPFCLQNKNSLWDFDLIVSFGGSRGGLWRAQGTPCNALPMRNDENALRGTHIKIPANRPIQTDVCNQIIKVI